jgi:hypothetical protein
MVYVHGTRPGREWCISRRSWRRCWKEASRDLEQGQLALALASARGAGGTVPFEGVAFKGVGYRFGARKSKPMMNVVTVVVS